jgi:hypothetical protein
MGWLNTYSETAEDDTMERRWAKHPCFPLLASVDPRLGGVGVQVQATAITPAFFGFGGRRNCSLRRRTIAATGSSRMPISSSR